MQHDYTDEEIRTAWKDSLSLRAFLDALPDRPQAQPGLWPGQQEAIDKAFEQIDDLYLDCKSSCDDWNHEAPARLTIAKAYDAARPQAAEIAKLKAALSESEKQFQAKVDEIARLLNERDKTQGILKDCLSVMPFGNIETHTVENLPHRIADLASELAAIGSENERLEAELASLRQPILAIEAECLAQAVRRMEAVPVRELWDIYRNDGSSFATDSMGAVRARLIAAARGEGQAQEVPQAEAKAEPATFSAHGKTWTRHTPGDPMPCEKEKRIYWLYRDTVIGSTEHPDVIGWERNENKSFDIIGWCYADEPAQAEPEPAQPWTPAVGDVVRLKSGGPMMTVNDLDEETHECECVSMSQGCIQRFLVFAACLTPVQP